MSENNTHKAKYLEYVSSIPVNVEGMIKAFDIELDKNANLKDGVLGEIKKIAGDKYKISIQKKDHYYRKRFTMAHELGHYLFHRDKIGDGIDDSEDYRPKYRTSDSVGDAEETEANGFAAGILMPSGMVLEYAKERGVLIGSEFDEAAVKEIATAFQVSVAAMKITLNKLKSKLTNN
jgi:Zn-dependent peptidase ImmA (M78 family)